MTTMNPHGKPGIVVAAGGIGLLIAAIALINFVNLMTARSDRRAVEVGVRKVSGAERFQLVIQFIGESLIFTFGALILAMGIVTLGLPALDASLVPGVAQQWPTPFALVLACGFAVGAGVLGGAFPAFVLSAFRPSVVMKGKVNRSGPALGHQALVAMQFSVLIALTLATMVVYRQIAFSLREGLRYPQDQLLIVYGQCPTAFTENLGKIVSVVSAACASGDPSNFAPRSFTFATRPDGTQLSLGIGSLGFGLLELLGVQSVAGRLYDANRDAAAATDERVPLAILNESAMRAMDFRLRRLLLGRGFLR